MSEEAAAVAAEETDDSSLADALAGMGEGLEDSDPPEPQMPRDDEPAEPKERAADPEESESEEAVDRFAEMDEETLRQEAQSLDRQRAALEKQKIAHKRELRQRDTEVRRHEQLLERLTQEVSSLKQQLSPEPEDDEPTYSEDPEAGMRKLVREELKPVLEGEEARRAKEEEEHFSAASSDIVSYHEQTRTAFVEKHPDYLDAAKWLAQSEFEERAAELAAEYPDADDEEIRANAAAYINNKVLYESTMAAANRKNLHDKVYRRALARGWSPDMAAAKADSETRASSEGDDPKLLNVAKGVRQSRAPRPSSGPTTKRAPTKKDIDRMDDDQYAEWLENAPLEEALEVAGRGIHLT